jgi:hypothetical protein
MASSLSISAVGDALYQSQESRVGPRQLLIYRPQDNKRALFRRLKASFWAEKRSLRKNTARQQISETHSKRFSGSKRSIALLSSIVPLFNLDSEVLSIENNISCDET